MAQFLKESKKIEESQKNEDTLRLESKLIDILNTPPTSFFYAPVTIALLDQETNTLDDKADLYNRLRVVSEDAGRFTDEQRGKAFFAIYLLAETNKINLSNILMPGANSDTEASIKEDFLSAAAVLYEGAEEERRRQQQVLNCIIL
ncbi:MAG: hypothetical protein QM752_00155 [Gammaproteobacteria bacterium]